MKFTIKGRKLTMNATVEGTLDQKLAFITALTGASFESAAPAPDLHLWTDAEVQAMKDRGIISIDAPEPTDIEDSDCPF